MFRIALRFSGDKKKEKNIAAVQFQFETGCSFAFSGLNF